MNPLLFNIYIVELEERLEKRGIGGVGIGNKRVWNLAWILAWNLCGRYSFIGEK